MVTEQIANLSAGNRRLGSSPSLSAFVLQCGTSADLSAGLLKGSHAIPNPGSDWNLGFGICFSECEKLPTEGAVIQVGPRGSWLLAKNVYRAFS